VVGRKAAWIRQAGTIGSRTVSGGGDYRGSALILYLDSGALLKLYVDEEGASQARRAVGDADVISTFEIAYVELRAALARRYREGALKLAEYRRALRDLHRDWQEFFLIVVGSALVREAGALAERYRLRAYDAVHLASSLAIQAQTEEVVIFACWDRVLAEVAVKAGPHPLPFA
jgi:predicted nucleic acid-binding protein